MSHKCSSCFGTRSKTNQNNHYQTSLVLRLPFNRSFIENRFIKFIFFIILKKGASSGTNLKPYEFRLLCDDGNCGRFEVNVKNIRLTDLKIKISWGARPGTVKKVSKLP